MSQKIRVLIIEDDDCTLSYLTKIVSAAFDVDKARSLQEGLTRLLTLPKIDVIALDLGLPDAKDTTAIEVLKEKFPSAPIVVVTANSDYTIERVIAAGAQVLMKKPYISAIDLQDALYHAIARHQVTKELEPLEHAMNKLEESHKSDSVRLKQLADFKCPILASEKRCTYEQCPYTKTCPIPECPLLKK